MATGDKLVTLDGLKAAYDNEMSIVEAVRDAVAPAEASTTASAAHAAGSYFILGGTLYQATADIASGGTITTSGANANCKTVPGGIGGEFNEAKTEIASLRSTASIELTIPESAWEKGAISSSSGENNSNSSTTRIRTTSYIPDGVSGVEPAPGYKVAAHVYNAGDSYAYLGAIVPSGIAKNVGTEAWRTSFIDFSAYPSTYAYRLVFAAWDDSDITKAASANAILYKPYSDYAQDEIDGLNQGIQALSGYAVDAAYQPVEYLESAGDGYVSTGVTLGNASRVVCDFAATDAVLAATGAEYIFGSRTDTSHNQFVGADNGGNFYVAYGATGETTSVPLLDKNRHVMDFNQNVVSLDGDTIKTFAAQTFTTPKILYLFCCNNPTSLKYGHFRIYGCKIWDDGTLARDFIPCVRLSDSKPGMYDQINGVFYASTGTFTVGAAVSVKSNAAAIAALAAQIADVESDVDDLSAAIDGRPYVMQEADRVSAKVRDVQTGNTLTFVSCSDLHYAVATGSGDGVSIPAVKAALQDMSAAILAIAKQTHIDFYACFGDVIYQWQSHGANYDNGVVEMISVTKLLNAAFGIAPQIRMVGNHDPNCENSDAKEFSAYQLNAYTGIYSDMLVQNEDAPYGGYGYHDFERQKIRLIVLNTSFYTPSTDLPNAATRYYVGDEQAYWLCQTLDLSGKGADAENWQIVICSHVPIDVSDKADIRKYTAVLDAYISGGSWSSGSYSFSFADKNASALALYLNGHWHSYRIKCLNHYNSSGTLLYTLPVANLYVPNALPGREETSTDGETYTKTAGTAESTAFQVITLDGENKILYAHHYGAGIDIIMHYAPSDETSLTTDLTDPVWSSTNESIATVSGGTVTPVADGYVMIMARSETDNCIECWNFQSDV